MPTTALATATGLLTEAVASVRGHQSQLSGDELQTMLIATRELSRLVSQLQVETIAALERSGGFAAAGYRKPVSAVANALTLEQPQAARVVRAAARVTGRVDLQGQVLPALLPATAVQFAAGAASLAHVSVIDQLMAGPAAKRLPTHIWAAIEEQIAGLADEYTPTQLRSWGAQLIAVYDQDGPEPDDDDEQVNELRLTPLPGGGGVLKGRFDDPARYATIVTTIQAMSRPLTADDRRETAARQGDALADACEFVLTYGQSDLLPDNGGERPHLTVTIDQVDLENRAQAGCLDTGDVLTPAALRKLCCDAAVIPVVLNGASQPLDIGTTRRTIPPAIRRAIAVRDHGCAHPGCDRPATWCQVHHILEWAKGGPTRLDNLVMLCGVHHREIHSTAWVVRIGADGIPEFIPPQWLDRTQKPRRQLPRPRPPARQGSGTAPPSYPELPKPFAGNRRRVSHASR
jgi:5-methylcytosine-specific restriction protein A